MNPELEKLEQIAKALANKEPSKYHSLTGKKVNGVLNAIPDAEKLLRGCQKLAAELAREYPSQNYSTGLTSERIRELHRDYINPVSQGGHYSTISSRMRAQVEKMQNVKASDFKFFSSELLGKLDNERCDSLLSEVDYLREFPEKIRGLAALIKESIEFGKDRNYRPDPVALMTCSPVSDQGKQIDRFDPRLT